MSVNDLICHFSFLPLVRFRIIFNQFLFNNAFKWQTKKCRKIWCEKNCAGTVLFATSTNSWAVGIATDYMLEGPGIESRWGEIFRPSRLALGPTQPPVQWVPDLSGGKVRPWPVADHSPSSNAAVMEE